MKLRLKEIIWEVTGKCKNGCSYCGSKDNWKEEIDETRIRKIVDRIAEYAPDEIDISGGDPLLVSYDTHEYLVKKLPNVNCKILMNPKSLEAKNNSTITLEHKTKILKLYKHVGVSINTAEELDYFETARHNLYGTPYTIITNYNITNFFLHDKIAQFIKKTDPKTIWQIQFTIYKEEINPLAIYNYPEAIEALNQSIGKHKNLNYIFADNANNGPCGAGLSSIGILANGDIVPCLSMRAWESNIKSVIEGNILFMSLKDIWMTKFQKNRFEENCICCKDICKKRVLTTDITVKIDLPTGPIYGIQMPHQLPYQQRPDSFPLGVMAYAVSVSPFITFSRD